MNLKHGDKSNQVREWQEFLNKVQNENLRADGNFGGLTEKATIRFQISQGIRDDGIVGPSTYAAAMKLGFVGAGLSEVKSSMKYTDEELIKRVETKAKGFVGWKKGIYDIWIRSA